QGLGQDGCSISGMSSPHALNSFRVSHVPQDKKVQVQPRVQRRLPIRIGSESKMCGGMVVDISETGMRIESPVAFPVNSVLTVFVQFPRPTVRLRARTIWTSAIGESGPHVLGLALTQAEPTLRQAFTEWVAEVQKSVAEERRGTQRVPGAASSSGANPAQAGP